MSKKRPPTIYIPRSIRVVDAKWDHWKARAEELGISVTALIHIAMDEKLSSSAPATKKPGAKKR